MSEVSPTPPYSEVLEPTLGKNTRLHLGGTFLSAIIPGTGQFVVGQKGKALVLLSVFVALLAGFWPLRLLRFFWGFEALFFSWIALYLYASCTAYLARRLPQQERPSKWWLLATLPSALLSLCLLGAAVTRSAGFRSFTIPSTSMEPALRPGDQFMVDLKSRRPERREVIVFLRDKTFFVKRVIAISGDAIEGRNGSILVNDSRQVEPYIQHTGTQPPDWMNNFGPVTVPNDQCFVMGDNRDISLDSRSREFGLVDDASIVGRPLYVFSSDRLGRSIH